MAQTGFDDRPDNAPESGDAAPKISGQRARQGQNIRGMLIVLIAGTVLLAGIYGVMLALEAEPASVTEKPRTEAATSTPAQLSPPPSGEGGSQETAGSPDLMP